MIGRLGPSDMLCPRHARYQHSIYHKAKQSVPTNRTVISPPGRFFGGMTKCSADAWKALVTIPPPPHPTYNIEQVVQQALDEDYGDIGDISSYATISPSATTTAQFLAKATGTLSGIPVATLVLHKVDPTLQVTWTKADGDTVSIGEEFGTVSGSAVSMLRAERVALNFMQRMSGTATATAEMVRAVAGTGAIILDTRKTVPGLRLVDKWAVLCGGGQNHRIGLYDMIMIKDNHVSAAGGVVEAVEQTWRYMKEKGLSVGVEVETRTLDEVRQVMGVLQSEQGRVVTRVMLDNMTKMVEDGSIDVSMLKEAVGIVGGGVPTEASGNVTLGTVRQIAETGVTYISSGALTHTVQALDISFNIKS